MLFLNPRLDQDCDGVPHVPSGVQEDLKDDVTAGRDQGGGPATGVVLFSWCYLFNDLANGISRVALLIQDYIVIMAASYAVIQNTMYFSILETPVSV